MREGHDARDRCPIVGKDGRVERIQLAVLIIADDVDAVGKREAVGPPAMLDAKAVDRTASMPLPCGKIVGPRLVRGRED